MQRAILFVLVLLALLAARHVRGAGLTPVGDLPGGSSPSFESSAAGISVDGSTAVGRSKSDAGGTATPPGDEAFRWTVGGGIVGIGDLPDGPLDSAAHAANSDGSVIVGYATPASGVVAPFRWTSSTGIVSLGDLPGGTAEGRAHAVSDDGAVVAGSSRAPPPRRLQPLHVRRGSLPLDQRNRHRRPRRSPRRRVPQHRLRHQRRRLHHRRR